MESFWDERAKENAEFFVDDRLDYRNPDIDRFWNGGEAALDRLFTEVHAPGLRGDETLLEIGCGVGRLTRVLAKRARKVIALDISAEMLRRAVEANRHLDNVDWRQGDGTSLVGVADASVDAVISLVVFQHIPDPTVTLAYVREMGRVLKPGGWTAFQVSNDPGVHQRSVGFKQRLAAFAGRAPKGQDHPAWLGSSVDLDQLRAAAASSGLEVGTIANPGSQFCLVRLVRPDHATGAP